MPVNYEKLFSIMEERNVSRADLQKMAGISANIIAKLNKNMYVSMETLEAICNSLNCTPNDLMAFEEAAQYLPWGASLKTFSIKNRRIDPPYNSRQYCDSYHVLENVARWEKPEVHGLARKMERGGLRSRYCTKSAAQAFQELVEQISARYILFSYNNMAERRNQRSNAKISDEDIMRILGQKGEVLVFSEKYKAFTTGKSDLPGNEERLFLCKVAGGPR